VPEKVSACKAVRDLYERHIPYWREKREAMELLRAFLAGDRYEEDNGVLNKDIRLNQIRGQEIQDTIRHIVAQATAKPRQIEARPIDHAEDPDAAELAVALIQHETANPWKDFDGVLEESLQACREQRLGVVWVDWEPGCGDYGEILFSYESGARLMWDAGFTSPHHPMCGWLIREKRMDADQANETYGVDWIKPDREQRNNAQAKPGVPLVRGGSTTATTYDDNKATIWECWYKHDKTTKIKENQPQELKPAQRYLACMDGCGYRSPTQAALLEQGTIEGELPDLIEESCPDCGGDLARIDAKKQVDEVLSYSKGKRLVVMAPYSPSPEDKPCYDGPWPIPGARSFPGGFFTAYPKPGDPIPQCDTDLMWDQQLASDRLRTRAVQAVMEHRSYWVLSADGITDAKGKRFVFRDDQRNVMFKDMSSQFGTPTVERVDGSGLDPQFATAFGVVQQALTQHRGISDLGVTPERAQTMSGVAIAEQHQIGEIPTAHFVRRKNRELSRLYGVLWDYIRATYTPERLRRLNIDGVDFTMTLSGDDLPNYDFVIEDTPDFTGLEKAKAEASQWMIATISNPVAAPYLDLLAELNGMPPSVVRKFQRRQSELPPPMPAPGELAGAAGRPVEADVAPQGAEILDGGAGIQQATEQMGAL
jgi:hypothetical protein